MVRLSMTLNKGVLKVTGSHVHFKSGSVLKTLLDKDIETTVHKQEVICHNSNCDDLGYVKVIH